MSDKQEAKSTVGPPMWVESLLTPEEYRECSKKYPTTYNSGTATQYSPSYHKGGRWRYRMGGNPTKDEAEVYNAGIEKLRQYYLSKKKENDERRDKEKG